MLLTSYTKSHMPKIMPIGPSADAGEVETYGRKARKYIRIFPSIDLLGQSGYEALFVYQNMPQLY